MNTAVRSLLTIWALVLVFNASPASAAPSPDGRWEGPISVPGTNINVIVVLHAPSDGKDGALTGDISIPTQHLANIALEKTSLAGPAVKFSITGIPGDPTFDGKLSDDGSTIAGDFTQGGQSFPFELKRSAAPDPAAAAAAALDGFDAWLDKAREDWHVPGVAIAIVQHGQVVYAKGSGVRDLDTKAPVTTKTLFAIGSSTKAFTTFVMGTLAEEGKLDFDKPVRTYMPAFTLHDPIASEHMTPRDLVTHRSGLPRHDLLWYNSSLSRTDLVSRLKDLEPNAEFRAKWQYNNLMFLTAGVLIETLTSGPWEDAVRARILTPLGMSRTNFSVSDSQKSDDFAFPYERRREGDGTGPYEMRKMPFRDISTMGPAGSINSCVDDMAHWVTLHLGDGSYNGKKLVSAPILQDLHHPQMILPGDLSKDGVVNVGYAMGWFVDVYRGHLRVQHGGNIDGFSALVALLPDDDLGMVVLCNMNASRLPGLVQSHASDRLLKLEPKDWSAEALAKNATAEAAEPEAKSKKKDLARKPNTHPSHELREYAAQYEHPAYGVITIAQADSGGDQGGLSLEYNHIHAPLEHWHYDTFVCGKNPADPAFEDEQISFRTGLSGDIDALEVPIEPTLKPMVFTRRAEAGLSDPELLKKLVGEYDFPGQVAKVTLSGSMLTLIVPGQPPYELIPQRDLTFGLKGIEGFRIRFTLDQGAATAREFISLQPNGAFTAKRKD